MESVILEVNLMHFTYDNGLRRQWMVRLMKVCLGRANICSVRYEDPAEHIFSSLATRWKVTQSNGIRDASKSLEVSISAVGFAMSASV